jgi:hypothetical protein
MRRDRMTKIVAFAAIVEIGTVVALLVDPALVVALLLGTAADAAAQVAARCFGIALLALAAACWPASVVSAPQGVRAMLIFNALIALFLAYLGTARHMGGRRAAASAGRCRSAGESGTSSTSAGCR